MNVRSEFLEALRPSEDARMCVCVCERETFVV